MTQNPSYNAQNPQETSLARQQTPPQEREIFGKHLTQFRKAAGFSQHSLAREIGVTQRIIAHYEGAKGNPPLYLLPRLAKALGVTVDQLLGLEKAPRPERRDTRLWRRFTQVEKLPPDKKKKIVDILDAFLGKD